MNLETTLMKKAGSHIHRLRPSTEFIPMKIGAQGDSEQETIDPPSPPAGGFGGQAKIQETKKIKE